jgi:ABC-type spermidine/putrescine transport system permease subunit I
MILTCYLSLQAMTTPYREAARSLGASQLTAFRRITFPLAACRVLSWAPVDLVPTSGSISRDPRPAGMMLGTVIEDQFTEVFIGRWVPRSPSSFSASCCAFWDCRTR